MYQTTNAYMTRVSSLSDLVCSVATINTGRRSHPVQPAFQLETSAPAMCSLAGSVLNYLKKENDVFLEHPDQNPSGPNPSGVSSLPVRLTISGPDLPTLTVVDLPGKHCSVSAVL